MSNLISKICDFPTAFDLDKVIAELEQEKDNFQDGYVQTVYYWKGIDKAIETIKTIKQGGGQKNV